MTVPDTGRSAMPMPSEMIYFTHNKVEKTAIGKPCPETLKTLDDLNQQMEILIAEGFDNIILTGSVSESGYPHPCFPFILWGIEQLTTGDYVAWTPWVPWNERSRKSFLVSLFSQLSSFLVKQHRTDGYQLELKNTLWMRKIMKQNKVVFCVRSVAELRNRIENDLTQDIGNQFNEESFGMLVEDEPNCLVEPTHDDSHIAGAIRTENA